MALNVDLMLEIREQITSHPGTHNQDSWGEQSSCGTTHCIAGWACAMTGAHLNWYTDHHGYTWLRTVNDSEDPEVYAGRTLGLDEDAAKRLFYSMTKDAALTFLDKLIEEGKNAA